jgi:holliday junction DNA helicase RuvA
MIGAIKGKAEIFGNNYLLIMAGSVGYKVFVNSKLLENFSDDKELFLYTHTHIREDAQEIYGFKTREELFLFELLIEVSGIGPKTGLLIMERSDKEISQAIISSDVEFFTNIPRIGRKNAQKIIIELKSKLGSLTELDLTGKLSSQTKDINDALSSMGFNRNEVNEALRQIPKDLEKTEDKIKAALKLLGGK